MGARFIIGECHSLSGVGIFISGTVEEGVVMEGNMGRTLSGKKFTLVKIEKNGFQIPRVEKGAKANFMIKGIVKDDLRPGESVNFD